MSSSMNFNPEAFLDMPVDAPFEKRPPLPVRDYTATILEVTAAQWMSKDQSKSGMKYDLQLELVVPDDVQASLGLKMPTFKLKDSIMLDMNEAGGLDTAPGKNRQLRVYREALGMNKPGVAFRARDMQGKLITVRLKHEDWQGTPQERVDTVAALG